MNISINYISTRRIVLNVFLLLVVAGCVVRCVSAPENGHCVIIDPDHFASKQLMLSEIGDSVVYLTFSSDIVFNRIIHAEYTEQYIFLGTSDGILKYDWAGSLLKKIGQLGQGPGEYLYCNSFSVDNVNNYIYVWSRPEIKVFTFDGEYVKTIKTENTDAIKLSYVNDRIYLFSLIPADPYQPADLWTMLDTLGNKLSHKPNTDVKFSGKGMTYNGNFIYQYNSRLGYWNHYNDTIFTISDTSVEPGYIWNFGSYKLTPEKNVSEDDRSCISPKIILEADRFLYINYSQNRKRFLCMYDKALKEFTLNKLTETETGFENNIDLGLPFVPEEYIKIHNSEYFIQYFYPDAFDELGDRSPLHQEDNDGNQIAMLVRLR